jgi:competence protein ComEC
MKNVTKIILSALVLLAAFLVVEIVRSPDKDSVQIYFFNVGQGDAELIQKGDKQILIDGGPDDSILSELGKVMPLTDRNIETVILTHPHADHLTGLNQVLERYQVGQIYLSGAVTTSNTYLEFLNKLKEKSIATDIPSLGEKISPFENGELTFLWPGDKYKDQKIDNLNNASEVAKFCYFAECAVFVGDQETDEQKMMFAELDKQMINYSSSILKIAHHGSTNGTDQTTLDKIKPKYAVIEVGADNKFGHPHAATLDLLNRAGVKTYRTDRDSTVEFLLEENEIITK